MTLDHALCNLKLSNVHCIGLYSLGFVMLNIYSPHPHTPFRAFPIVVAGAWHGVQDFDPGPLNCPVGQGVHLTIPVSPGSSTPSPPGP
jgi:hypothetical protein